MTTQETERDHWLNLPDPELLKECDQESCRSRGKGGQKVNKTSVAIRLTHRFSGISAEDDSSRSQHENRLHALHKLRHNIALQMRKEFSQDSAFQMEPAPALSNHQRYSLWLATVLDCLAANNWDPKETALQLNTTRTHLLHLLFRDSAAWQYINIQRTQSGLYLLKGN